LGEINDEYRLISIILQHKGFPFLKVCKIGIWDKQFVGKHLAILGLFQEEFERSIFKRVFDDSEK
jgi:hypothetical protein